MENNVPRVSAANIIPSLNLIARTDVPVTMGCLQGDSELEIQIAQRERTVCVAWRQKMPSTGPGRDYGEDRLRLYRNCHISAEILSVELDWVFMDSQGAPS